MTSSWGGECEFVVLRKTNSVDLLRKSLGFQLDALLFPVPDAEQIIGVGTHAGELLAGSAEGNVRVGSLGSLPQDAVQFHGRVRVDVDVRVAPFFRHCEIRFTGVNLTKFMIRR